jgi:cell division protein FtsB
MGQARNSGRRSATRRAGRPRIHLGRLVLLMLVLIAAAFYVSPLRAFFSQQDRYQREAVALHDARASKAAMEQRIHALSTRKYVAEVARVQSNMVPPGTEVFVVRGLPGAAEEQAFRAPAPHVTQASFSVLDRVEDLWRTVLH